MKKLASFLTFAVVWALAGAAAQSPAVEVSFVFARQTGAASNQIAVWIEDAQGRCVKTLYATRYTAQGGWERRPMSLPQWVKRSGLSGMSRAQVDAISRPTPRTSALTLRWDGTDVQGTAVPPGEYQVFLEATLRWEYQALYSAPVRIGGGPASVEPAPRYTGDSGVERRMISQVVVKTLR